MKVSVKALSKVQHLCEFGVEFDEGGKVMHAHLKQQHLNTSLLFVLANISVK